MRKYFFVILLLFVVVLSYGQTMRMGLWQDDNAIFFKILHINENAGAFGSGLFGSGPYRFIVVPYWIVYKLFGLNPSYYYFLMIVFYFIASICVYKFFSIFISKSSGIVAGFLFACGYIASDGYGWISNALVSDISVITLLGALLYYYKNAFEKRNLFYFYSLIFYFASAFLVPIRSYYFFGIFFVFEIFVFSFQNKFKYFYKSILKLLPFFAIFMYYFVINGDVRNSLIGDLAKSLFAGKFYFTYGFFVTLTNLFVPDKYPPLLFSIFPNYLWVLTIILFQFVLYLLFRNGSKFKIIFFSYFFISIAWLIFAKVFFSVPELNLSGANLYSPFLGGMIFIFLTSLFFYFKKANRNKYIFIVISLLISIGAYYLYQPTVNYNTTHRYLVGSLPFLVGLFGFIYFNFGSKTRIMIVVWGLLNLFSAISYQHEILLTRTYPVENFYKQMKSTLSEIKKGDIFYFDLANNKARSVFTYATSTASMPNETSIAWRYGVDRDDLKIETNFDDYVGVAKKHSSNIDNIHSFYFDGNNLINTTSNINKNLSSGKALTTLENTSKENDNGIDINLNNSLDISSSIQIAFTLRADKPDIGFQNFPLVSKNNTNDIYKDNELRSIAFKYSKAVKDLLKNSKIKTSSEWQSDFTSHLTDGNIDTNWRSDRIEWGHEDTYVVFDMHQKYSIDRLVWVNGFSNSSITKYSIDVADDGKNWKQIKEVTSDKRIDEKNMQVVSFDPVNTRYIRMDLKKTLDGDAPQLSEIWLVPSGFENINISEVMEFLDDPFAYVPDEKSYVDTLNFLNYFGNVDLYWQNNNSNNFVTKFGASNMVSYDGLAHQYLFTIPAGGFKLFKLELKGTQIKSKLHLVNMSYRYFSLKDLLNEEKN